MLVVSTSINFPRTSSLVTAVSEIAAMEFDGVEMAAATKVEDAFDAATLCREKRVRCPTIAAPLGEPAGDLSSPDDAERARAVAAVLRAVPIAAEARTEALVVRLCTADPTDRDRRLDAAARSLFDLTRAVPELTFSIRTPSGEDGFPNAGELSLLFEDASGRKLAYSHDVAAGNTAEWLAVHGPRALTLILGDPTDGTDWREVKGSLSSGMIRVLELDPNRSGAELLAFAAHLKDLGIVD